MTARRFAVVGSGVAGLVAAHVLSRSGRVTLFEAAGRPGGHALTRSVSVEGRTLAVDCGFIVHNDRTYPTLLRLFDELGVQTHQTDMSMSIRSDADRLEYAGGQGLGGLLPSARLLARPRYLRMLVEVRRFHRAARALLAADTGWAGNGSPQASWARTGTTQSLGDFLDAHRFGADFRRWFLTPLVSAVWSCDPADALRYPAGHLFTFLDHHGMLGVLGSPPWRTVDGGSRSYVEAIVRGLDDVRLGCPVTAVHDDASGVTVVAGGERTRFDAAVIAVPAPTALGLLAEPSLEQRRVLGAFELSRHVGRLHTDTSLLPRNPRARASWNYLVGPSAARPPSDTTGDGEVVVTYDLTRLQRLTAAGNHRLLLTLNGAQHIDEASVLATMEFEHPLFTAAAVAAQAGLPGIDTDRIAFAGAWQRWGFHEDGAASGLRAAERLGARWSPVVAPVIRVVGPRPTTVEQAVAGPTVPYPDRPDPAAVSRPRRRPTLPVLYEATVVHARREPVEHRFRYRSVTWLVDLDHLPDHGVLGRFEARDHVGDPTRSIRANIEAFLAAHGIDLTGGRILMLAMPRVAGYCFNPISVHWCVAVDGRLAGVVVEVHNTYGDRHAYLVHPDAHGRAEVDKALYVSPFNDTSGRYRLRLPEPGERLDLAVTLLRPGRAPFVATMRGTAVPATRSAVRRLAWRHPVAPLVVAARIRRHGIALWRKGLRVQPRPFHPQQDGLGAGKASGPGPVLALPFEDDPRDGLSSLAAS